GFASAQHILRATGFGLGEVRWVSLPLNPSYGLRLRSTRPTGSISATCAFLDPMGHGNPQGLTPPPPQRRTNIHTAIFVLRLISAAECAPAKILIPAAVDPIGARGKIHPAVLVTPLPKLTWTRSLGQCGACSECKRGESENSKHSSSS